MKPLFFAAAASVIALAACSPATEEGTPAVSPPPVTAPAEPGEMPPIDQPPATVETATVITTLAGDPEFSSLAAAIEAAGLTETLSGAGPYTVFAPRNDAFAALPAGELDKLLLPENKDQLVRIVGYHVIPGRMLAADVPAEDAPAATASINNLDLSVRRTPDGAVLVNDLRVVEADIETDNGIIHIVDGVLMPRMQE